MNICLTSGNIDFVDNAEAQICTNCGFPNQDGTLQWDIVKQAYQQSLWYITKPGEQGWNQFTQEQMMDGVVDVEDLPFDPSWLPPELNQEHL